MSAPGMEVPVLQASLPMRLVPRLFQFYLPDYVKRRKLQELFGLTATAFGAERPDLQGLRYSQVLVKYALFTSFEAARVMEHHEELAAAKNRLFAAAHQLGEQLRQDFGVVTVAEAMPVASLVYRVLGIDFKGDRQGDIVIDKCFFSDYYSEDVCRVISSLDAGVMAGLSGGGRLVFSQRITEGKECCRCSLVFAEAQP